MTDDRSYLDRTDELAELYGQEPYSNEALSTHFALYGPAKRIEVLQSIDRDLETGSNIRKVAREMRTMQQLKATHMALIKAGR